MFLTKTFKMFENKFLPIVLLGLILYGNFLFSQNLTISYKIESTLYFKEQIESLRNSTGATNKKISQVTDQALSIADQSTYNLEISDNYSHFYLNQELPNEANDEMVNKLAEMFSNKGTFYQDVIEKKVIERTSTKEDLIAYDFSFYDWQLFNETKDILGFTCYKATVYYEDKHPMTGAAIPREITVWYAPDLPAYFGPQGYGGLPGLILKKCQSGKCFVASKIVKESNEIVMPKGELLSREKYQQKLKDIKLGF